MVEFSIIQRTADDEERVVVMHCFVSFMILGLIEIRLEVSSTALATVHRMRHIRGLG